MKSSKSLVLFIKLLLALIIMSILSDKKDKFVYYITSYNKSLDIFTLI
jgi:hypothetical protein